MLAEHNNNKGIYKEDSHSDPSPPPILPRNFKILKSSYKRHVTSLSEQLTVNYYIQRSELSAFLQLLFTDSSSCSAPATIAKDVDELPPTHPLSATTAADHLIPRTEIFTNLPLLGIRTPSGAMDPKNYLLQLQQGGAASATLLFAFLSSNYDSCTSVKIY
ncbi:hypothetical protein AVEN_4210-1 [Araneus ventricosus]|uniref:Uncharacterized protein n=1 Tax=Araneus ventricosus TaxID=182803 RepID=A0A4Y2FBC5_ARAVE|nr:hypothetical protein AVEN_4210-1 [Araneus ventricosus]